MPYLEIGNQQIEVDQEGFLCVREDWNHRIAVALAQRENIELSAAHWVIIELLRRFYARYQITPAMRPLIKYIKQQVGEEQGTSLYLLSLFPNSPAKIASKIAGLPKPTHCL